MYLELNDKEYRIFTTYNENGEYCVYFSTKFNDWEYRVMDFISFHTDMKMNFNLNIDSDKLEHEKRFMEIGCITVL